MVRKVQASKAFLREKIDSQIGTGNTIGNCLTESEIDFTNLPYKAAELLKKNDDLSRANLAAQIGGRTQTADLKVVRDDWKMMFGKTADAVSLDADGSESMILRAGMKPTSNSSKKKQQPEQPANNVAKPGNGKGTCAMSVDAQTGVNGYVGILASTDAKMEMMGDTVKITPGSGAIYIQACSRRDMQIGGLPSYVPFCATIFTFNSAGSSPLSNSEEMAAQ